MPANRGVQGADQDRTGVRDLSADLGRFEPDLHSVRVDVWAELKRQTDIESVAVDFATTRKDLNAAAGNLGRLFERYEKIRARLDGAGVIAQMKLSPMLEAAYREWIRAGSDEPLPRVFTEIPDPPIGPEPKE